MAEVGFGDWCIFKLEDSDSGAKCLMCLAITKQKITAVHVTFKKMVMGACCGEDCFKSYKEKYGL